MNKITQLVDTLLLLNAVANTSGTKKIINQLIKANPKNLIEQLLSLELFNISLIATKNLKVWDITKCSLWDFLVKNTQWNPISESYQNYLNKQPAGQLLEVLIITDISNAEKAHFKKYLQNAR